MRRHMTNSMRDSIVSTGWARLLLVRRTRVRLSAPTRTLQPGFGWTYPKWSRQGAFCLEYPVPALYWPLIILTDQITRFFMNEKDILLTQPYSTCLPING